MNYNLSESKGSKTGYLSFELEKITQKIFIKSGYKVDTNEHSYIDLIASLENTIYYVEVKSSSSIQYKNHFYLSTQTSHTQKRHEAPKVGQKRNKKIA